LFDDERVQRAPGKVYGPDHGYCRLAFFDPRRLDRAFEGEARASQHVDESTCHEDQQGGPDNDQGRPSRDKARDCQTTPREA
jgi:hypothetical protein